MCPEKFDCKSWYNGQGCWHFMHGRKCFGDHPTHLAKENMCHRTSCDIFSCGKVHGSDLNDWFHGFVESLTQNLLHTAEDNTEFRCAIMSASQRISQQMAAEELAAQLIATPTELGDLRPTSQTREEGDKNVILPTTRSGPATSSRPVARCISPFDTPEEGDGSARSHLHPNGSSGVSHSPQAPEEPGTSTIHATMTRGHTTSTRLISPFDTPEEGDVCPANDLLVMD